MITQNPAARIAGRKADGNDKRRMDKLEQINLLLAEVEKIAVSDYQTQTLALVALSECKRRLQDSRYRKNTQRHHHQARHGKSKLRYQSRVTPAFFMPGGFVSSAIGREHLKKPFF